MSVSVGQRVLSATTVSTVTFSATSVTHISGVIQSPEPVDVHPDQRATAASNVCTATIRTIGHDTKMRNVYLEAVAPHRAK